MGSAFNSKETYSFRYYEKSAGLSLKSRKTLKEFSARFFAYDDLLDKTFTIKDAYHAAGKFPLKKTCICFKKKYSERRYEGELFVSTRDGKFRSNVIRPVEIEICSDLIDGSLEIDVTQQNKPIYSDLSHNRVVSKPYGDAIRITSFTINIMEQVS